MSSANSACSSTRPTPSLVDSVLATRLARHRGRGAVAAAGAGRHHEPEPYLGQVDLDKIPLTALRRFHNEMATAQRTALRLRLQLDRSQRIVQRRLIAPPDESRRWETTLKTGSSARNAGRTTLETGNTTRAATVSRGDSLAVARHKRYRAPEGDEYARVNILNVKEALQQNAQTELQQRLARNASMLGRLGATSPMSASSRRRTNSGGKSTADDHERQHGQHQEQQRRQSSRGGGARPPHHVPPMLTPRRPEHAPQQQQQQQGEHDDNNQESSNSASLREESTVVTQSSMNAGASFRSGFFDDSQRAEAAAQEASADDVAPHPQEQHHHRDAEGDEEESQQHQARKTQEKATATESEQGSASSTTAAASVRRTASQRETRPPPLQQQQQQQSSRTKIHFVDESGSNNNNSPPSMMLVAKWTPRLVRQIEEDFLMMSYGRAFITREVFDERGNEFSFNFGGGRDMLFGEFLEDMSRSRTPNHMNFLQFIHKVHPLWPKRRLPEIVRRHAVRLSWALGLSPEQAEQVELLWRSEERIKLTPPGREEYPAEEFLDYARFCHMFTRPPKKTSYYHQQHQHSAALAELNLPALYAAAVDADASSSSSSTNNIGSSNGLISKAAFARLITFGPPRQIFLPGGLATIPPTTPDHAVQQQQLAAVMSAGGGGGGGGSSDRSHPTTPSTSLANSAAPSRMVPAVSSGSERGEQQQRSPLRRSGSGARATSPRRPHVIRRHRPANFKNRRSTF